MSDPRKLPDDIATEDWEKLLDSFDEVAPSKAGGPAPAKAGAPPAPPKHVPAPPPAEATPVDTHQVKTAPPPPILHEALHDVDDDRTRLNAVPVELLESVRREAAERAEARRVPVPKAPKLPSIPAPDDEETEIVAASSRHLDFVEEEASSDLTRPDLTTPEGMELSSTAAEPDDSEPLSLPPESAGPAQPPPVPRPPLPPRPAAGPPPVPAAAPPPVPVAAPVAAPPPLPAPAAAAPPPVPAPAAAAPPPIPAPAAAAPPPIPAPAAAAPPPIPAPVAAAPPPVPARPPLPQKPALPRTASPAAGTPAVAPPPRTAPAVVSSPPLDRPTEETKPPVMEVDIDLGEEVDSPSSGRSPTPSAVVEHRVSAPPPLPPQPAASIAVAPTAPSAVAAPAVIPPKAERPATPRPVSAVAAARSLSEAPRPLPPSPDATFSDERDAVIHLDERGTLDEFRARAEWLEAEARLNEDAGTRTRGLLVASELRAMVGDDEKAYTMADEVLAATPDAPFAHRQARAGKSRARLFPELLEALDAEVAAVALPDAALAAGLLAAEITRLVVEDDEGAAKRMQALAAAHGDDPRSHVDVLRRAIAASDGTPSAALPSEETLAPLAVGFSLLAAARGAEGPASPSASLSRARAALSAPGPALHSAAADALAGLAEVRGVGPGAAWLSYALASAEREARPKALLSLRTLLDGPDARAATRAGAIVALQLGDQETATEALADEAAFTLAERAAFVALAGTPLGEDDVAALTADETLVALAAAASVLSVKGYREPLVGTEAFRLAQATGRALAVGAPEELAAVVEGGEGALYDLLHVETASAEGRLDVVAEAFSGWAHGQAGDRDRALVASVLFDLAGEHERAVKEARRIDVPGEVVARILLEAKDEAALAMLQEVAETTDDPGRRSTLLLETVLRREGESDDTDDLLQAAHAAAPELPFAAAIASKDARLKGDVDGLLAWIRLRRDGLSDPREIAFDNVREAMLVADTDLSLAVTLLEQSSKARPEDVGLRDLLERLSPEPLADRADYLERAVSRAKGKDEARLALTAAWERERSGDLERAAVLAQKAMDAGGGGLARRTRDRVDFFGSGASRLAEELMEAARATEDAAAELGAFEQLAHLDEVGRGDVASGLLWHRSILEKTPGHLPSLRKIEQALISEGREEELEPIFAEITRATASVESVAHAQVAARLGARNSGWETTKELVEAAASSTEPTVWALRQLIAHARASGDDKAALRAAGLLAQRTDRPDETSALHLRAGEAAFALGELSRAKELLESSIEAFDGSIVARLLLAEVLRKSGNARGAAEELEATAALSRVPRHAALLRYDAALLWLDVVSDAERGTLALEAAGEHDIGFADIAVRLQKLYIEGNERSKLAALLQRRLDSVEDPEERVALEVLRGLALAEVGDSEGAKSALAAALDGRPDHVEALRAFVTVCSAEEDWENVEQATIRLARLLPDPAEQASLYQRLGALYEHELPNPERAEQSYREVLKRDPENVPAAERVVALLSAQNDLAGAIELQTQLINSAVDPAEKRRRSIDLARIHETVGADAKKAEQMLEALRKEGPQDSVVLRALAEFHVRHNHGPAVNVLLDRTANDARRALTTGRFDLHFFANLGTVFELRGKEDAAEVAHATVAALEGRSVELIGIGARAGRPELDDLVAPEIFTPAFRELLLRAGEALDAAVAVDLKGIRATAISSEHAGVVRDAQALGEKFGLPALEVLVSPTLGPICLPASVSGPTIVYGAAVLDAPVAVRQYLTLRALSILRTRVAAFARTPPIELWPLAAALLKIFVPTWDAPAADANKVADYKARIEKHLPPGLALGAQAHEVIGSLGNRASTLQTAANSWGARVAFLGVGDLSSCLSAIAFAAAQPTQPAANGADRMTWTGRNAEARDLAVFSVNDAYVEARARAKG